jgi:hypothetical protein
LRRASFRQPLLSEHWQTTSDPKCATDCVASWWGTRRLPDGLDANVPINCISETLFLLAQQSKGDECAIEEVMSYREIETCVR